MKRVISTIAAVSLAASISTAAQADQRSDLTEVEVSLWEIVGAVMYYAFGNGDIALEEFNKQQDDVATHWTAFTDAASDDMATAIALFSEAYEDVLEHANEVVNATSPDAAMAAADDLWRAAHLADDILDFDLKARLLEE